MTNVAFGQVSTNRGSFPPELTDLSVWPSIDFSALSVEEQAFFSARRTAVELYVLSPHISLAEIEIQTGLQRRAIYRILARCVSKHADGRIYGFRAALPYARLKQYERANRPDRADEFGLAGAFGFLLERYPSVKKYLLRIAEQRHRVVTSAREVRKPIKSVHKGFLEECRKAGIKSDEYPFNQKMAGFRSLASFFTRYDNRTFESAARSAGCDRVGGLAPSNIEQAPPATRAFEVVEFDGHKIDLRITVRVIDPFGFETLLELTRIWILVLLDVASRAVIGYKIALSREYNKDDVAGALQSALTPFIPRQYKIPGLSIRQGGGYPSSVLPQTRFACWDWFRFDGAKSHLAPDTIARLNQTIGCWPDNGPAADPDVRPFIERFFHLIAKNFAHRLPGTTGSNPQSIERALSDPNGNNKLLVELDELEDMIEVLIADYNGEPHGGISSRTPLEAMAQLLAHDRGYLRTLPLAMRPNLCLLQEARIVTIKGSVVDGVRPYINFLEVRYTSNILSSSPGLIGEKLRIYFDVRDIRSIRAYFEDGAELGVLTAGRPWCFTPHSVRVRQEISRLKRTGKLKYRDGDDPVEAWEKYKRAQGKTNKRAATDLAKANANRQLFLPASPEEGQSAAPVEVKQDIRLIPAKEAPRDAKVNDNEPPQPRVLKIKRTITF